MLQEELERDKELWREENYNKIYEVNKEHIAKVVLKVDSDTSRKAYRERIK